MRETVRLIAPQIDKLSSGYLRDGRRQEVWRIETIDIGDDRVVAKASMTDFYVSRTDDKGFHLSFITALEMVSQLTIVYLHYKAGLTEKSREVWVSESRNRFVRPVRNPDDIRLEMTVKKLREHGGSLFCEADYRVTDEQDGLYEYWGKACLQ
jgi:acyl-coenzyme A thioesterase PaaI-like protein